MARSSGKAAEKAQRVPNLVSGRLEERAAGQIEEIPNPATGETVASIFTTSGRNAREFQRRIEAGMLGVNVGVAAPMAFLPFTCWKGSFFGDLHATGADPVRFYTRQKAVTARWF